MSVGLIFTLIVFWSSSMKFKIAFFLFLVLATSALAQVFTITKTERQGDNLILYYGLLDSINNRAYTINVYSSSDNYINPLSKVSKANFSKK